MTGLADFQLIARNSGENYTELVPLTPKTLKAYKAAIPKPLKTWLDNVGFAAGPDEHIEKRDAAAAFLNYAFVGVESFDHEIENPYDNLYALSGWTKALTPGIYALSDKVPLTPQQRYNLLLGWGLSSYRFDAYKKKKEPRAVRLVVPQGVDREMLLRELHATAMVQDMVNEPANIMTPSRLELEALSLAEKFSVPTKDIRVIRGDDLLNENDAYPLIHTVGRAAAEEPRLVDIRWGDPANPIVTILGKGITFDTGGLTLKDEDSMRLMKYDMAGAAHAIGLAHMIMDTDLPVRLRLMLPIAENAINSRSYKPGDVVTSRKGETIEIINTDAEGRMILADTLYEAAHPVDSDLNPDMVLDFGTLSWFGNYAYPDWSSNYPNNKKLGNAFARAAKGCQEYFAERPVMWSLMKELEDSLIADVRQCNDDHIDYDDLLAVLFLARQVGKKVPWMHLDLQPWKDPCSKKTNYPPNMPAGAFASGLRSAYAMIRDRYTSPEIK